MPGEIVPGAEFYDYEDKYVTDGAQLLIPAPLTPRADRRGAGAGRAGVRGAARATGLARIDFFFEEGGRGFLCNEANTMPGFTPISMYPKLWQAAGMSYPELDRPAGRAGVERHGRRRRNTKPADRVHGPTGRRGRKRPQLGRAGRRSAEPATVVPADAAERLGLGGDAGDRAVGEGGDEAGVAAAEAAGVHLGAEEPDRPGDERVDVRPQAIGLRRPAGGSARGPGRAAPGGARRGGTRR